MNEGLDEKIEGVAVQLLIQNILELNKQELLPLNMLENGTPMLNSPEQFAILMYRCKDLEYKKIQETGVYTDEYFIYSKAAKFFDTIEEVIINYDENESGE